MNHRDLPKHSPVPPIEPVYAYPGLPPRLPYMLFREAGAAYFKVLLRDRFLFISTGTKLIDRGAGELDIPHVGANRQPASDFVYDRPIQAQNAFERFQLDPRGTISRVRTGRKP